MLPLLTDSVGELPGGGPGGSFCEIEEEANLLPVFLSLTAPGLKPNSPPMLGACALGCGLGCSGAEEGAGGVYFLTPPMGGGGGGGGGAPPVDIE